MNNLLQKNMKSDYNNIQIDSKAVLTEDSTAAPSSPLLSRVDRTEERSEFVNVNSAYICTLAETLRSQLGVLATCTL